MQPDLVKTEFRNDIQGLRALAVIFVLIFHLSSHFLPGGFIGVDMFFVISGYLISRKILFDISQNNFSLLQFYIGRIKRIIPAYYILLISIYILFLFIYSNTDLGTFRRAYFWTFLFLSNNYFPNLDDYFGATSSENPFLHTWTLSIEMQFYLVLPIILLAIKKTRVLAPCLLLLTVGSVAYSAYEIVIGNKSSAYFSLVSRSAEFLIGVLITIIGVEKSAFVKENSLTLVIIGLLGLFGCAFYFNESVPFPGVAALVPCLSIGMILASPNNPISSKVLSHPAAAYIGEISYSIYLWHWPIMAFYRYHTNRYSFTFIESLVIISLTVVASLFSYYAIERKVRRQTRFRLFIPITLMAVINAVLIYTSVAVKNKITHIPAEYSSPQFGLESHGRYFEKVGTYGSANYDGKRILFLGDSHALTFKPYLHELGKSHHFSFRSITNDAVPSIPWLTPKEVPDNYRWYIYKRLSPYIESEVDSAQVIVIHFANTGAKWIVPLKKMFDNLKEHQKILILSDYPSLNKNPVRLNKSFIKDHAKTHDYEVTYKVTDPGIIKLINAYPNVRYVDLSMFSDFFDDAPFYKDTLIYYDGSHLNYYGSMMFSKYSGSEFIKNLNWALGKD